MYSKACKIRPRGLWSCPTKIEEIATYWVELNKTVSDKRVKQLYSQNQTQEVIDKAKRQAVLAS